MSLHDAWSALRHGGNLLSPAALDGLPAPHGVTGGLSDRLRTALVAIDPGKPELGVIGDLLDVVLEDVCGLRVGWEKGNALGLSDAEKLLDGTVLKPKRRRSGDDRETLVVFPTLVARLGVGKGRRPVAQVVEYLRRRSITLGLITNGTQWRLIWADSDNLAWVEWEAERWLAADQLSDELAVLQRVLSPQALTRNGTEPSPLLAAIRDTRRGQAKLSSELGERVRQAVELLLKSREPIVGPAWEKHDPADLYVAASHFVMRLVVTLFAEARELLPTDNPVYHQAYGLSSLLDQLDRITSERRRSRTMAWPRLLALFQLLHQGSPHPAMSLPAYGGELFRPGISNGDGVQRALALLESLASPPDDNTIHRLLVLLTRTTQRIRNGTVWRNVAAPVDFTELTSEYIGILYEGLLDYELHRAGEQPIVFLNLGDQPALPLDRLEAMDDKSLISLVEKAKVKKQAAVGGEDEAPEEELEEATENNTAEELDDSEEPTDNLEPTPEDDDDSCEDATAQARARVRAWSRRAAKVAGLVKKSRSKKGATDAAFETQLDEAANNLKDGLKLPGELYLVRWGGTRKGAGTFYTRPQLTLPTVRRTLEPLIYEDLENRRVRPAEALLQLKVCDPAMGSGSFLVAALRVLTSAVIESLHVHQRITRENGRTSVGCELLPEADRHLPTEGFEERLEVIVRRAVVEHCLYGVDLDPLAVELGRVALWVETLDRNLPFTFLDHKLRCGNSLVGTWLDRFRDYPLLCFDRKSPDVKYHGVHHTAAVWQEARKGTLETAISEQMDLITGQQRLMESDNSDEELKTAVERVRRLYRELRAVPAGRPDERARVFRQRIQTDLALARVREAFDTWCALWFWPLDRLSLMPLPSTLAAPCEDARAVVRTLREQKRFFHWELEFPDVFIEEGAGFDAVVGNPPWEIQKPSSKEFFSNHDPLYRAYGKQEALRVQRELFASNPAMETEWLAYNGDFKDRGNFARNAAEPYGDGKVAKHGGGAVNFGHGSQGESLHKKWRTRRARFHGTSDPAHPFLHQGAADLNTYKMFAEAALALLREGGQLGLVVPSGIYTDKGTSELRRQLLSACAWRWLYGFENRNRLFDIHRSFKFCVVIAEKGGHTEAIQAAFMRHDLEDWSVAKGALAYPAERVTAFSPKSLSVLEIRTEKDLQVLTRIYANGVLLGDEGPNGWGIRYAREFDMTNDSKLFIQRDKAKAQGFRPDLYGRWINDAGEVLLPLYEGRMIGQFDFSEKGWVSGKGRSAVWREIPWEDKRLEPQFLMRREDYFLKQDVPTGRVRTGFMDVTSATNKRTMIATLVPSFPAGNKVPILETNISPPALASSLCSLAFDWQIRQRLGGITLNYFIVEETILPKPQDTKWAIDNLSLRLAAAGTPFFSEFIHHFPAGSPVQSQWAITPHERLRLRCMLDAIVAVLYGLDREDFTWILKDCDHPAARLSENLFCRRLDPKGFWRVDKAVDPELRHPVLSLAAFDDLQVAVASAGDRDAGIQVFCNQNDGDGWMLPECLCLADLNLTRTTDVGEYDERARLPQPVRSRMGARFLDWQLAQTPEESWAECERHAQILRQGMEQTTPGSNATAKSQPSSPPQGLLPGLED